MNSEPGPMVIRSADAIASRVCGKGFTSGGTSTSSLIRPLLAVIMVSPRTRVPSSMTASSSILDVVAGKMCPRVSKISADNLTASAKSLVIEVNAARKRLPKL